MFVPQGSQHTRTPPALLWAFVVYAACGPGRASSGDAASEASVEASDAATDPSTTDDASTSTASSSTTTSTTDTTPADLPREPLCTGQPCDFRDPTSCPENFRCVVSNCACTYDRDEPCDEWSEVCLFQPGGSPLGQTCSIDGVTGEDRCAKGLICQPGTDVGPCIPMCTGSPDDPQCPAGYTCVEPGVIGFSWVYCFEQCDPLSPDPQCFGGCTPWDGVFLCTTGTATNSGYGTPCSPTAGCDERLSCQPSAAVPEPSCEGEPYCCTPYCDLNDPAPCPGQGQVCEPFLVDPLPSQAHIGVCRVPMP